MRHCRHGRSIDKLHAHDAVALTLVGSRPRIQTSANLLSHNLGSLHATLSAAQPLLISAHAYPLPSFPGRTREDLLGQLLRKKLQPPVEDWIEEGVKLAAPFEEDGFNGSHVNGTTNGAHTGLSVNELESLWEWAGPEGNRIARELGGEAFDDVFTLAEQEDGIENVVTGLRRKFFESDDEDDSDDKAKEEDMEIDTVDRRPDVVKAMYRPGIDETKPMMPLEDILRFVSQGKMPPTPGLAATRPGIAR